MADATTSTSSRAALAKADAAAAKIIKDHAASSDWCPSHDDVLSVLRLIDKWPTQARPNVTSTGKSVPGMCLGLVFALGQGLAVSHASSTLPNVTKLLASWVSGTVPETGFPFSSLQVGTLLGSGLQASAVRTTMHWLIFES